MTDRELLLEKFLKDNALWVIMDPWLPTPYIDDYKLCPNIDKHNQKTIDKIVTYIKDVKNVCVSCLKNDYDYDVYVDIFVHPQLQHLDNVENNIFKLNKILNDKNIFHIVYCGFHYGDCIVFKEDGCKNTSKMYKTYVKRDLCSLFPNEYTWEEADKITEKYAKII